MNKYCIESFNSMTTKLDGVPKKLEGTELTFLGIGRDISGRKIIRLSSTIFPNKSFVIYTKINIPTAYSITDIEDISDIDFSNISKEVNHYVKSFGVLYQIKMMHP